MFSIFKILRRDSLQREKITKYLVYAFGEIFLIVIGILIALQITNWNEARKAQVATKQLLLAIQNEFENNLTLINNYQEELIERNKMAVTVLNFSAKSSLNIPIDSVRLFASQMFLPQRPLLTNSTVKEAVSSGTFALLDRKLSLQISVFEDLLLGLLELSESNDEIFRLSEQHKLPFYLAIYQRIFKDFFPEKNIAIHPDLMIDNEKFTSFIQSPETNALITQQFMVNATQEIWIQEIKKSLEISLEEIQNSLSK